MGFSEVEGVRGCMRTPDPSGQRQTMVSQRGPVIVMGFDSSTQVSLGLNVQDYANDVLSTPAFTCPA